MIGMSLHQMRTHPVPVEGCFGCKASTLVLGAIDRSARSYQFQASITPQDDMDAYVRFRKTGLQPPTINGSARLERHANHRFEVERGKLYRGKQRKQFKEALTILDDHGFNPSQAHTVGKEPA